MCFPSPLAAFCLSSDVLWPSARQSASLFVQGLGIKSVHPMWLRSFVSACLLQVRPPARRRVFGAGMAGWELSKLPAASHASCLAVTRPDRRHSTQLVKSTLMLTKKKKKNGRKEITFFISPPVCHLPISLEVKEWHQLMTAGPEAAPALAQEQHVSRWHHARPASVVK